MTPERWTEVDRLFHAALELRPDERLPFLRNAARGDDDLRVEVESLLRHEQGSADFLESPALQHAARQLAAEADSPPNPEVPGYTILKELGEGGMGIVYLAEQMSPIHRQVALKLIKHGMDTRHVVARFAAERQTLALMRHPHIATVFDAGTTADGRPYFAMEYVDGEPITEYCDRRMLTTRARLALFMDTCAAVQHAHQKGVIHRDLKPSNVLVTEEDGKARPKIIDFGVARAVERPMTGRTGMTEQGALVGTPEYMSPEQAALSPDIDTATDVYSLGVLLYELLVGALPFDPRALRDAGYDEMRRVIRENDPPRPSSRLHGTEHKKRANAAAAARRTDAGRLARELKGDLDWIILKALEKDRRRRYATVAAFAADVTNYLSDEPVTARPHSMVYRAGKFTRRYRGAVAAVAAVILALVAGLATAYNYWVLAEDQARIATANGAKADQRSSDLETALNDSNRQRKVADEATAKAQREEAAAKRETQRATLAEDLLQFENYTARITAADKELLLNQRSGALGYLEDAQPEFRGWEWSHLKLKTDTSADTLVVEGPCAGADGQAPATISDNVISPGPGPMQFLVRRCTSWTLLDGSTLGQALRTTGRVLATGSNGAILAAEVASPWAMRWIPASKSSWPWPWRFPTLGPMNAQPMCAAISPDGLRAAVGYRPEYSDDDEPLEDVFEVWDLRTQQRLRRLTPTRPQVFDARTRAATSCNLAFSPDSSRLATSGFTVNVWLPDSDTILAGDSVASGTVAQPIAWSPDNRHLAIGRLTGLVDLLDAPLTGPRQGLQRLDPNGLTKVLRTPDRDRRVLVPQRRKAEVLTIAFSADGKQVVTGTDVNVAVWDVIEGGMTQLLLGHTYKVIGVAADNSGRLISVDSSGLMKLWPRATTGAVRYLRSTGSPAADFALGRDGKTATLFQADGRVSEWQLDTEQETVIHPGTDHVEVPQGCEPLRPANASFPGDLRVASNDGRLLAYGLRNCLVVRDLSTREVRVLREPVTDAVFLPDGAMAVAVRGRPVTVPGRPALARLLIWDWRTKAIREAVNFQAVAERLGTADWKISTDSVGNVIAVVGGSPAIVSLWSGDLSMELGQLPVPGATPQVALNADGSRLASTSGDNTVRIWSVSRQKLLLTLHAEDDLSGGIAFTPDNRLIAGRSAGGLVIWDARPRR